MNCGLEVKLLRFLVSFLLIGSTVMTISYFFFSPNPSILNTIVIMVVDLICFGIFLNIFSVTSCLYGAW